MPIRTIAIAALAAVFLAARMQSYAGCSPPEDPLKPAMREAPLEVDKVLPLWMACGAGDKAEVLRAYWVRFSREGADLHADLRIILLSWPSARWRISVALRDIQGTYASAEGILKNAGFIETRPAISEDDVRLTLKPARAQRSPPWYVIRISPAPETAEPTVEVRDVPYERWFADDAGDRVLEVAALGPDGKPATGQMTLWRAWRGPLPEVPLRILGERPVTWQRHGKTWVAVRHIEGQGRIEGLAPDQYCVSFLGGDLRSGSDPTPVGATRVVDLVTDRSASETIRLAGDCSLTVHVVEPGSGKPLGRLPVLLRRDDGLPLAPGASAFATPTDANGTVRYGKLEAGAYWLEVGHRDWWYAVHPESVKVLRCEVKPGGSPPVTVPYAEAAWRKSFGLSARRGSR